MPDQKTKFKNWVQAGQNAGIDILQKGTDFAASIRNRDRMVVVVPALTDGSVVMGSVYRAALDEITTEFPSCHYGDGEDHQTVAHQLSRVHSESVPTEIVYLGEIFPFPGVLDLRIHLYACRIPGAQSGHLVPPEGMLDIRAYSTQELTEAIAKGSLCDASTIACLMRYMACRTTTPGPTPTMLKEIEYLDATGRVVGGARTNKPEWSFLQFSAGNTEAIEWRFKDRPQSSSPMGDDLPVKPSLAMLSRHLGAFKAGPAYAAGQQDSGPNEKRGDTPVTEDPSPVAPEGAGPSSEVGPAPAFLSTRRSAPEPTGAPAIQPSAPCEAPAAPRRRMTLSLPEVSRPGETHALEPRQEEAGRENTSRPLVAQRATEKLPQREASAIPDLEKILRGKMEKIRKGSSSLQVGDRISGLKGFFRRLGDDKPEATQPLLTAPRPIVYGVQEGVEDLMSPGPAFRPGTRPGTGKES